MKPKIELDQAKGMTWGEVIRYYFPEGEGEGMIAYILWEQTCFPFDTEKTLDQIYEYYIKTIKA